MPPRNETAAPAALEHSTLYVAVEVSRSSWVVGIKGPCGPRIGIHTLAPSDADGLVALIARQRARGARAVGGPVRVLCCYEAGYEGFWLARRLGREASLEVVVLDPASLPVNRKAKQRKTDRIDARKMVRALVAYDRGETTALGRVRVPSVAEEDRRRPLRERARLVKERTALGNRMGGLLKLHGIFDLRPRARGFVARLGAARTGYGEPLPPHARDELERLAERLALVERQIAAIEAARDAVVRQGRTVKLSQAPAGSAARAALKIATLAGLKGIGENDATLLTHEVLWRDFRNRRELAGWLGIVPAPWASGRMRRDQGIGRDGPAWVRAHLVQMAWRWLRHQPDSALAKWYHERTAGAPKRVRKVMAVALARKLLVALWRFAETGLVPTGARLG